MGDGGGRALPLHLPPGCGGEFGGNPCPLALPGHVLAPFPAKPGGIIPALSRGTSLEEDP